MGDYTPKFLPGQDVTYIAAAALTGGSVVEFTAGNTVNATSGASAKVAGVVKSDCASGDRVTVTRGGIQRPIAGAVMSAGDPVKAAASGQVILYVVGTDPITQFLGITTEASTVGNPVSVQWKA